MLMIPATPHGTHSQAEKRVFDRLRAICTDHQHESLTACHSLNLTQHAYKRFGEIDFLICGHPGIFVLEVKGGRIACKDGVWQYTNRYEVVTESVEGPFKQAESALHGLMANLNSTLSQSIISQFTIGYGVIFPDCKWSEKGAEWDRHLLADAQDLHDFEQWLRKLFKYWQIKDGGARRPDDSAVMAVQHYLRPEFEAAVPLYVQAEQVEERVVALTDDQMAFVDVVAANKRVLCSGGAGTGKTFLALELARRWTAEGMQVVLACRSLWLRRYLETQFSHPGLTVTLAESIKTACRRAAVNQFDALIVDEGQDLFDMGSLANLDASLKNGLSEGRWAIFHDVNNQSGFFVNQEQEAIAYLMGMKPALVPLRINCRNTRIILEKVQTALGADMGVRGVGEGPEVREWIVKNKEDSAGMLAREISEIIDEGGIASGNVTILSPHPFNKSSAVLLNESQKCKIMILDEYSLRSTPFSKINFAQIANFKGLENEAVIVVDLAPPVPDHKQRTLHYIAMSRARAILSLIFLQP